MQTVTAETTCPHCWQTITLVLDLSVDHQTYIEDCEVCCQAMQVTMSAVDGELIGLDVEGAS
jgi:hypothetical protein